MAAYKYYMKKGSVNGGKENPLYDNEGKKGSNPLYSEQQ